MSSPARDGETLSEAPIDDEQLAYFRRVARTYGPGPEADMLWLCDAVAALRSELADARVDAERLDWMESTRRGVEAVTGDDPFGEPTRLLWVCDEADAAAMLPTLREAIDAARAASGEDASHE